MGSASAGVVDFEDTFWKQFNVYIYCEYVSIIM